MLGAIVIRADLVAHVAYLIHLWVKLLFKKVLDVGLQRAVALDVRVVAKDVSNEFGHTVHLCLFCAICFHYHSICFTSLVVRK